MRSNGKFGWLVVPVAALGLLVVGRAQSPPGGDKVVPATRVVPAPERLPKLRDGAKLAESAQPIFFSASRALEWLKLTNKPDGRFVYGFQPALRVQLEGDNFLSQAGATFALARAARYYRDRRGTTIASQAALRLLLETVVDPQDKTLRHPFLPATMVNRLSAGGALVSAIHELDSARDYKDLLDQADQLCNYLRRQQRADGSLFVQAGDKLLKTGSDDHDAKHAGWALQGIIRSQRLRPADWKLDALRKARAFYSMQWQRGKSLTLACSHTPAYAEAFLATREAAFKDAVFAMNDWLVELQFREDFDSARKHWTGGFPRPQTDGKLTGPPDISSAHAAESLAEACRVARAAGDLPRLQRFERAFLLNMQFLLSLQYTAARTQHFVPSFRPSVLGAFHASNQDGNLRIDYTQPALAGMVQYLDKVIE
ncbi:MAG: hypothetical protein HYX68_00135 [Planctomycetes bacterium]|nr:hypothetical protein [Planctomycetota bacterium]